MKHQTLTVTRRLLTKLGACQAGVSDVSRVLPARISTDPERNIELAIGLVNRDVAWRLTWLWDAVADNVYTAHRADGDYERASAASSAVRAGLADAYLGEGDRGRDPYQVAQALAMLADRLLITGALKGLNAGIGVR